MKTTRKGQAVVVAAKQPVATGTPASTSEGKVVTTQAPSLDQPPAALDPRAAIKALALEHKVESRHKNKAAEAAGFGARLMNLVRGESSKKAFAVMGLGMALLGTAQGASAEVVNVGQPTTQAQTSTSTVESGGAVLEHMLTALNGGQTAPASSWLAGSEAATAGKTMSPQEALIGQKLAAVSTQALSEKPDLKLTSAHGQWLNTAEIRFDVPAELRSVKDGQSVLIPLEGGRELHMIELRYQDTRPLKDFEFNRRAPGGQWETFRGDEYRSSEEKEKAGQLEIKREPDHHAMWINNPIRVKVEVVDANGNVLHTIGKKFLDPQLHDAWSPEGPGSAEVDNISNGYEKLPEGKLPPGAQLRLTPVHEHKKPWEAERTIAMDLSWVKPIYMPEHSERALIRQGEWEKPATQGYHVEAGRPIAAVLVKWTDHGGTSSGSVRITKPDGSIYQSPSYNVGSGETELIPLDGVIAKDGKLHIAGWGLEVGNIEVLYR